LIVPVGPKAWGDYLEKPALFNVAKDPGEKADLIGDPKMDEVRVALEERLDQWWRP